jgi:hypothetical protein
MQKKILYGTLLMLIITVTAMIKPSSATDTLTAADFKLESFSKTVDFFDYARAYAASHDKPVPPANWHAYLYQNYINVSQFQLIYSGLINITTALGQSALTIPVQSFIEHYKTPKGKDVLTSSSFIMLLAFNETPTSTKYVDSPDINDNLYASFTLGFDISNMTGNANRPALNSKTELIPLTSSSDKLEWSWGMRYTNLTAIWWRMDIDPAHPSYDKNTPVAITTYEELTFMYNLAINATDHTAKVTASYVIGRMTNLWVIYKWVWFIVPIPIFAHLNSTGTYYAHNGTQISGETIYQFIERQHIKMSIVLFQNSLVLGQTTMSTFNDKNVTDAEDDVSGGSITTQASNDNEKIFDTDFGTKASYRLYNYTTDRTETKYNNYTAVTRTVAGEGFAKNPLFSIHVALLRYLPLVVAHIDPSLYAAAKDHMLNMTYADYFYIISYPEYSGFKIAHDPTYTAYIASTAVTTSPPTSGLFGLVLIVGIVALIAVGAVYVLKKRAPKTQAVQPPTQQVANP